ncbi:hypothetical protein CSUI_000821, partial [Cystoisospora suis]
MFNEESEGQENEVSTSLSPSDQKDTQPGSSSSVVSTIIALDDHHAALTKEKALEFSSSSALLSSRETASQRKKWPESKNRNFKPSSSSSLACKGTDGNKKVDSSSSSCPYDVSGENPSDRLPLSTGLHETTHLSVSRHSKDTISKEGSDLKPYSVDVERSSSVLEDATESYHSLSIQKDAIFS